MDKQDLILAFCSLILVFLIADRILGAEIYYEDGSYVNVPDDWVDVSPSGPVNCQDVPDDPRCGQGYIEWEYVPPTYTVNPSKYRRQGAFEQPVTSGSY